MNLWLHIALLLAIGCSVENGKAKKRTLNEIMKIVNRKSRTPYGNNLSEKSKLWKLFKELDVNNDHVLVKAEILGFVPRKYLEHFVAVDDGDNIVTAEEWMSTTRKQTALARTKMLERRAAVEKHRAERLRRKRERMERKLRDKTSTKATTSTTTVTTTTTTETPADGDKETLEDLNRLRAQLRQKEDSLATWWGRVESVNVQIDALEEQRKKLEQQLGRGKGNGGGHGKGRKKRIQKRLDEVMLELATGKKEQESDVLTAELLRDERDELERRIDEMKDKLGL